MSRARIFLFISLLVMISGASEFILMNQTTKATTVATTGSEVWLTLPDQSKKLSREADLTFTPGTEVPQGAYRIEIDETVQYQRMEGFGAAMTDSSAWLLMRILSDRQREAVMRNLFTREGEGIGLSYVRIPIGASDFALHDYSYDDMPRGETDPDLAHFSINYDEAYIIPALQMAQELNPQLRFMGSPWSAPGWMKSGGSLHGGTLLPEYYGAFSDYLVKFIQAYAGHGVTIDSLTPQNEPMFTTDGYPTMRIASDAETELVRDHLGPALRDAGLPTRIVVYDHNWDMYLYPMHVLGDPAAAAYIDGVAFHCYGGDVANQSLIHDAYPDKNIWFTECSGGGWAVGFANNLSWNIRTLAIGNFRNWGNSMMLWNLALDENSGPKNGGCQNCRGVVTVDQSSGEVTYNEEFYILGHLSKLVDPGAYRIESTAYREGQPENVAFLNPDGSLVLVVHATQDVTFAVAWQGQHFDYTLPAGGVVTFKWNAPVSQN